MIEIGAFPVDDDAVRPNILDDLLVDVPREKRVQCVVFDIELPHVLVEPIGGEGWGFGLYGYQVTCHLQLTLEIS